MPHREPHPETIGRFPCHEYSLNIAGRTLRIVGPKKPDDLLDDPAVADRYKQDEYLPYWAIPWPAAAMLADFLCRLSPPPAVPVLELGCGLGLVAVSLALSGIKVVATDYDDDAVAFARANASLNNAALHDARALDWREPPALQFETIVAADVLYESRILYAMTSFLCRALAPDGTAFISDPSRRTADDFEIVLIESGLVAEIIPVAAPDIPDRLTRTVNGRIFRIRRDKV